MARHLILTSWNQKNKFSGIEEYFNIVKDVCDTQGIELFGLYRPLTDKWHWTYLISTNSLEEWENVEDTVERYYLSKRDQIIQKISRIYVERVNNPKPRRMDLLKYLEVELSVWEGINVGIQQYFDAISNVFREKEDAWFMGQYSPASERYNWAHFFMYKSLNDLTEMDIESYRAVGRPHNLLLIVERLYKLYEID